MEAAQLVGVGRALRPRRPSEHERVVIATSAIAFAAVCAGLLALLPSERSVDPLLVAALVAGYALVSRVRFEFGNCYAVPEQLVFVPLVALAPLPAVPLLVTVAALLAMLPDFVSQVWHRERWLNSVSDGWFSVGPVLVLAALAPAEPTLAGSWVYLLAFAAQIGFDLGWSLLRGRLVDGISARDVVELWSGSARVDAILSPIAFIVTVVAVDEPAVVLAIAPLVWLLQIFSREREEKYGATLELHRAYRGTVMLLSDVVEFDDPYTAEHSRSIADLVHAVAEELGIDTHSRQEFEFAALLHDVGKIAVPKEILNKPSALSESEFELIRTHTIEGQFMLDRVGGLLGRVGEIVRSCHERWDGKGYPDGLAGEDIPIASRIVFACDAYNAMTTDRPYRAAMPKEAALAELVANAGTQFDPRVVATLVSVVERGEPSGAPVDALRVVRASGAVSPVGANVA
jgi:HD-GYP domain-containing protein (c-di-GMP phosphodiesterase class II)